MTSLPNQQSFIIEVEQEVLGSIFVTGEFNRVRGLLRAEHFIEPLHQFLFGFMEQAAELYGSATLPIVIKLIPEEASRNWGARLNMSLTSYITNMTANCVHGPSRLEATAKKVVQQWARVRVAEETARISVIAGDSSSDPMQLITTIGQSLDDIAAEVRAGPRRRTRVTIASAAENAISAAELARQRGAGITGITWGLSDVNRLTGGIQRRDLTLIGARPSMGKTSVGLSTAIKAAKMGAGVGFISLEMDADKLAARAMSDMAYDWNVKLPYTDIIRGQVDEAQLTSLRSATQEIEKLPIYIEEQSGLSITDIRVKVEAMADAMRQNGDELSLLMIDHLGLIRASSRYSGNRVQEISEMTSALKSMAREFNIAVVLLSQLNRSLENRDDKRPHLSDLRDSGAIEQDADTIIFLYREAYYLERDKSGSMDAQIARSERLIDCQNKLEFTIAKQRNGPLATIDLFADMSCSAIRNGAMR